MDCTMTTDNPSFESWATPFGAPPFARIKPEHFMPAFERAFAEHEAEITTIAGQKQSPTFDNTIVALENAGRALQRAAGVLQRHDGVVEGRGLFLPGDRRDLGLVLGKGTLKGRHEMLGLDAGKRRRAEWGGPGFEGRIVSGHCAVHAVAGRNYVVERTPKSKRPARQAGRARHSISFPTPRARPSGTSAVKRHLGGGVTAEAVGTVRT